MRRGKIGDWGHATPIEGLRGLDGGIGKHIASYMLPRGVLEIEVGGKERRYQRYSWSWASLGARKENSSAPGGLLCSQGADFRLKHFNLSVLWLK